MPRNAPHRIAPDRAVNGYDEIRILHDVSKEQGGIYSGTKGLGAALACIYTCTAVYS